MSGAIRHDREIAAKAKGVNRHRPHPRSADSLMMASLSREEAEDYNRKATRQPKYDALVDAVREFSELQSLAHDPMNPEGSWRMAIRLWEQKVVPAFAALDREEP